MKNLNKIIVSSALILGSISNVSAGLIDMELGFRTGEVHKEYVGMVAQWLIP